MSYKHYNQKCCPCNENIHEPPERDTPQRKSGCGCPNVPCCGDFPPPEPPDGNYDEWELQFCKWWGWTWVRKGDKQNVDEPYPKTRKKRISIEDVSVQGSDHYVENNKRNEQQEEKPEEKQPTSPKKKRNFFNCFKRKESTPPPPPPKKVAVETQAESRTFITESNGRDHGRNNGRDNGGRYYRKSRHEETSSSSDDYCCCCCCCCGDFQEATCPCMQDITPRSHRTSKTIETQTKRDVKETATKMSRNFLHKETSDSKFCHHRNHNHSHHHKKKHKHRRKCGGCCCRRTCCPCMRTVCCPCIAQNNQKTPDETRRASNNNNDKIVGFSFMPTPKDLSSFKTANFSILHKPLDLLLKNNYNITKLFLDTKFCRPEEKKIDFVDVKETVSYLSMNENVKKSDPDHCKLLTAVCDAILSSHKFEEDKPNNPLDILKVTSSKSTQKSWTDSQTTHTGILDKILKDPAFQFLHKKVASNEEVSIQTTNVQSEIGVQVSETKKTETYCQTNPTVLTTKLHQTNRPLSRFLNLRSTEPENYHINCLRGQKRTNLLESPKEDSKKIKVADDTCKRKRSRIPLKVDEKKEVKEPTKLKYDSIEKILKTIDYTAYYNSEDDFEAIFRNQGDNTELLDATPPPFTQCNVGEESIKKWLG